VCILAGHALYEKETKGQSPGRPIQSPRKRLQWSNNFIEEAMEAVRTGVTSINKAAFTYNVPS